MLKLGIIGLSEGNGHPYSFSAIFNGYNEEKMKECPYPVIYEYLSKQDKTDMCISDAKATHIWTQDKKQSMHIAEATFIRLILYGGKETIIINFSDTFYMFKKMLSEFINMIKTGRRPIPLSETLEIVKTIDSGNKYEY